jgi:hypothetical protein
MQEAGSFATLAQFQMPVLPTAPQSTSFFGMLYTLQHPFVILLHFHITAVTFVHFCVLLLLFALCNCPVQ